jgi:hypothetical protein
MPFTPAWLTVRAGVYIPVVSGLATVNDPQNALSQLVAA